MSKRYSKERYDHLVVKIEKGPTRDQIAEDIKAFEKAGGVIERVPMGKSGRKETNHIKISKRIQRTIDIL